MPRKAETGTGRREDLEGSLADYTLAHGVADLSLRELAGALGISTYPLVYHFGSKDGLIAAILARLEERQRDMLASWVRAEGDGGPGEMVRRYWRWVSRDELMPYHRLYFEIYGLALRHPERFPGFLERGGVSPWLTFLRDLLHRSGASAGDAEAIASLLISTVAGVLLGFLTDGDRERAARTVEAIAVHVELWFSTRGGPGG